MEGHILEIGIGKRLKITLPKLLKNPLRNSGHRLHWIE